jgi:hypothetical protein
MDIKTVAPGLEQTLRPNTTIETAQQIDETVQQVTARNLDVTKTSTFNNLSQITLDTNDDEARTQAGLQAASGVVRSEELPQYELPKYNSELYDSTIGITKYDELRNKLNLGAEESFTDYYNNNNGYVPEGFELSAKLLLHEEKVKGLQDQYLNNEIGYDDFLYKAYGKDILKANGHDFSKSLYWYNKMRNGDYGDIRTNLTYMRSILNQSEAAHQSEVWFRQSGKLLSQSMLQYVNNQELPTATVRDLFKEADWASLDEQHGSTQKVIDLYRAGMLSGFQPWIDTDKDGKPDFYYHTDGKLYEVEDESEKTNYEATKAVAIYNADGSLQRIRVRNRFGGIGEFTQNVAKGGFDFVTGVLSLGALAFGGVYDLGELVFTGDTSLNRLADTVIFTEKTKNMWGWMGADYTTSSGFTNTDGTFNTQGLFNGLGYATGLIASMLITGGLSATTNPAVYKGLTTKKVIHAYADDAVRGIANLSDDVLKQPKTLKQLITSLDNLPNKYMADDIVAAANNLGIKTTVEAVGIAAKQAGYELGRTSAKVAMAAGRGALTKGLDFTKNTFRIMSGVRNGMPSVNSLGKYGTQIATRNSLAVLAAKEFAETAGYLNALQGENELSNGQILGIAAGTAILNFGIGFALRATLDEGALDRHAKAAAARISKGLKTGASLQKIMDSGQPGSKFISTIYNMHKDHPILLANIQNVMDITENLLTLTINNTAIGAKNVDGRVDLGTIGQAMSSVINPTALFMNAWMAYGNMRGNPLSNRTESGMRMGEIWNAQSDIKSLFEDNIRVLRSEAARLDSKGEANQASAINNVILRIEETAANRGAQKFDTALHAQLAALEMLDDVLPKRIANKKISKESMSTVVEALSRNYTNDQRSRMLVNARLQLTQYDAVIKGYQAKQREMVNGTLSEKIGDFINGSSYVKKIKAAFEKSGSVDIEIMEAIYNNDMVKFRARENIIKLASKDSAKIIDDTTKFIDTYVKAYTVGEKTVQLNADGTHTIVEDPKLTAAVAAGKDEITKNGDDPVNGMFIKIETEGKEVQNNADDKRIRDVYDAISDAGKFDVEEGESPLMYKVANGLYFIPHRAGNMEVKVLANVTHVLRNATLLRRSENEDVKLLSFMNILKVLATGEDQKTLSALPENVTALRSLLKKNTALFNTVEKVANSLLILSTDPNANRTLLDLGSVHKVFGTDYKFVQSNGMLYKFNEAYNALLKYQEHQTRFLDLKKKLSEGTVTQTAVNKMLRELKSHYINFTTDLNNGNLIDYMIRNNYMDKNFIKDLKEAIESMGELSGPQEVRSKIEKLFRAINSTDISEAESDKAADKLLEILSEGFSNQEQTIDRYKIKADKNIIASTEGSEILKGNVDIVKEFIKTNNILSMSNVQINDELSKVKYNNLSLVEKIELLSVINVAKIAEYKSMFNKNRYNNYRNTVIQQIEKDLLANPKLFDELGIVISRGGKKNKLRLTDDEFKIIENYVLDNTDLTYRLFSEPVISVMRQALNFRTMLFNNTITSNTDIVVVNVLELKGKTMQKLINGLSNKNVIDNLGKSDSDSFKQNIILQIFGGQSPGAVISRLNHEIKEIQTYYQRTKEAGMPGILTFRLSEEGSSEELNKLLASFNYDTKVGGDLLIDIPGVYMPGKVNNVDQLEVQSVPEIIGELKRLALAWEKDNREVTKTELNQRILNFKAKTSVNLETSVGGLTYVDDDTIIKKVENIIINDFELTSEDLTDVKVKNILSGVEYDVGQKQGLLASLTRQAQGILRASIGLMGNKNPNYSKAVNVVKIINATKNVINSLGSGPGPSSYRVDMTDEYFAKVNKTGMYTIVKVPDTKNTYIVQLNNKPGAFEAAAYKYIAEANKDVGIDLSVFLLAGKTSYNFKTEARSTNTIQSFIDLIKIELNLREDEYNKLVQELKDSVEDKEFIKYNFDNSPETIKEIQSYFNGKTVKEILSMPNNKYNNHIMFLSYINTIKASKVLSKKIMSVLSRNKDTKELGRKFPLLGNRAIREQLSTILNKQLGNSSVETSFFIEARDDINKYIDNFDARTFTTTSVRQGVGDKETEFANAFFESSLDSRFTAEQRFTENDIKEIFNSLNQKFDDASDYNTFDVINKDNPYLDILSSIMMDNTGNFSKNFLVGPIQAVRLTDEEFDILGNILTKYSTNSVTLNIWKNKLESLRRIANRNKPRTIGPKDTMFNQIENVVGNVVGSSEKRILTLEDGPVRKNLEKLLIDKAKEQKQNNKKLFKVSDANVEDDGPLSYMNQIIREKYGDDTNVGSTNKASRTFLNMNDLNNRSEFVKNVSDLSRKFARQIGNLKLDNDLDINNRYSKFVNLAEKVYAYTTGIDYSKEYTRYLLVDQDGQIIIAANSSGTDYKEVADFVRELSLIGNKIQTETIDGEGFKTIDGKKLFLLQLDKNMLVDTDTNKSPLNVLPLNNDNYNNFMGLAFKSIIDKYDDIKNGDTESRIINTTTYEEKNMFKVQHVLTEFYSQKTLDNYKIQAIAKLLPNQKTAVAEARKLLFGYKNYLVDSKENNLKEEAMANTFVSSQGVPEEVSNILLKNLNELFTYGFTNEILSNGIKSLLIENRSNLKLYISEQIKNYKYFNNDLFNKNESKALINSISKASGMYNNKTEKEENKYIAIREVYTLLSKTLNSKKVEQEQQKLIFKNFNNFITNSIVLGSNDAGMLSLKLLENGIKDLQKTLTLEDPYTFNLKDINGNNVDLNNILDKNILSVDVENVVLKPEYQGLNEDNNTVFYYSQSKINTENIKGTTREKVKELNIGIEAYLKDKSKLKQFEIDNKIIPVYVFDPNINKFVLVNTDNLKTYMTESSLNKLYQDGSGYKKVFEDYNQATKDLPKVLNSKEEVSNQINIFLALQFKNKSYKEFENNFILGYNSSTDRLKLQYLSSINDNFKFINGDNAQWLDVLEDVIREWNFDTKEFDRKRSVEALSKKFMENQSAGQLHDPEQDNILTSYFFFKALEHKQNSNVIKVNAIKEIEKINQAYYGKLSTKDLTDEESKFTEIQKINFDSLNEEDDLILKNIRDNFVGSKELEQNRSKYIKGFKDIFNFELENQERLVGFRQLDKTINSILGYKAETISKIQDTLWLNSNRFLNYVLFKTYILKNPTATKENFIEYLNKIDNLELEKIANAISNTFETFNFDTVLKLSPDVIIEKFINEIPETGFKINNFNYFKNNFSKEEYNKLFFEDEGKSIFNSDLLGAKLRSVAQTDSYGILAKESLDNAAAYGLFNKKLGPIIFEIANKISDQNTKDLLTNILTTAGLYSEDLNRDLIQSRNKKVHRMYSLQRELIQDLLDESSRLFTVEKDLLYKSALAVPMNEKLEVYNSDGSTKIVNPDSNTIYFTLDMFAKVFGYDQKGVSYNLINSIKDTLSVDRNDPLYVLSTRHPQSKSTNNHVFKIEVLANKLKTSDRTILMDRNVARNYFNGDFDGDGYSFYRPDVITQMFGKTLEEDLNFAHRLYKGLELEVLKNNPNKNSKNEFYLQIKVLLDNNILSANTINKDLTEINNSPTKYDLLKKQREEQVTQFLLNSNSKWVEDLEIDESNAKALSKDLVKKYWIKETPSQATGSKETKYIYYTDNFNFTSNSVGQFAYGINDKNRALANQIKTLLFKTRAEADTNVGEFNKAKARQEYFQMSDKLGEVLNFNRFFVEDNSLELIRNNSSLFYKALINQLQNKALNKFISESFIDGIKQQAESDLKEIELNPSEGILYADRLIDLIDLMNQAVYLGSNVFNKYKTVVDNIKALPQSTEQQDKLITLFKNYFGSDDVKEFEQEIKNVFAGHESLVDLYKIKDYINYSADLQFAKSKSKDLMIQIYDSIFARIEADSNGKTINDTNEFVNAYNTKILYVIDPEASGTSFPSLGEDAFYMLPGKENKFKTVSFYRGNLSKHRDVLINYKNLLDKNNGSIKLEANGKHRLDNKILFTDNTLNYYVKEVDLENNTIIYAIETTANGSTKIGIPGSALKGMGVPKSEANDKAIKAIVSKDVYKDIDLIADAKNLKPEKLGTVNKSGVFTYYDKDFNVIQTTDNIQSIPKAAYITLETKAKNVVFEETWALDVKTDKIGQLGYATELLSPTGILFGLGRNYRYENFEGDDKTNNVKLVYDNRGEAKINKLLKIIGGYNTGSMNAKLIYDISRMIKVLENKLGKEINGKVYTQEKFDAEVQSYINRFMVDPENSNTIIFERINELYGSTDKFVDLLESKEDFTALTIFENELSELFYNPDRAYQVGEGESKTSKKTGQAYREYVTNLKETIGYRTLKQTSKLKDLADAAANINLKEGTTYSAEHLDYLEFINYLIEGRNKYYISKKRLDKVQKPLSVNDIEYGIQRGLLNLTTGSTASTNNSFNMQPNFYRKDFKISDYSESNKSGGTSIGTENVVELTNKPQIISTQSFDNSLNLKDIISNKTTEYLKNNKYSFNLNTNTIDSKYEKTKDKNDNSPDNWLTKKNKVNLIGHAGKYNNIVERANSLGTADDEIVVNTNLKIARSTPDKAIELQMIPQSDKVELRNALQQVKNQIGSDLFAVIQKRIDNNEDINLKDIFVTPKSQEVTAQKELPNLGIKFETVKKPNLTENQLNLLRTFNINDMDQSKEVNDIKNRGKDPEQILAEYDQRFNKNKQLNSGNDNLYETDIARDVLESSGISTKTETGFITDRTIIQSRKNKVHYEMELSNTLHKIYDLSVRLGAESRISFYMFTKHKLNQIKDLDNRIKLLGDAQSQELKAQATKYELAKQEILRVLGGSVEESEKYLAMTEKYYGVVTKMADDYVQYVYQNAKSFMSWTNNPNTALSFLVVPNIQKGTNKSAYEHYKMNMFNQSIDPTQMSAFNLGNYNFFDSMKSIVKMISKEKAAFDIGRNLRMNGIMENQTVVTQSEELLEKYLLDQIKESRVKSTYDKEFDDSLARFGQTLEQTILSTEDALPFFSGDFRFSMKPNEAFAEKYVDIYRRLTKYIQFKGVSYDEAKSEMNSLDKKTKSNAEQLMTIYDLRDDVIVTLMKRSNVDVSYIYDNLKNYAAQNNLALTDKFGRLIPEKVSDFKVLSNVNFEYALKAIQYFSPYNGGFKNQVVLDMLAGDIYLTNKKVAEALDKFEYNRKPPSSFQRQMTKVTSLMTTLIMSNPFQLLSRAAKWTAGDLGWGVMTDWRTLLKQGDAIKDIRAMYSSKGTAVNQNLKEFMYLYGVDPMKMNFNLTENNLEDMELTGRIFNNKYTDFTGKVGNVQSMLERYAIFLALKDGFDTNKPSYGSVLNKQDLIDKMTADVDVDNNLRASANSRKAHFIMAQTLGAAGDFPDLAKSVSGYFMFTTYPLAMIRWARNEGASMATAFKNIFIESHPEKYQQSLKHLWVKGLGAAGLYAAIYLMNTLVAEIYGVDDETKDDWIDEQATPELLKTLLIGSPVIDKYNSINPIRQITEKTLVPFFEAYEKNEGDPGKTLLGGLGRFSLENFGNVNPLLKNTIELIAGGDIIEREVIPFNDQQDIYDNVFRKLAGYLIGSSGSRALTNYLNDIAPYQEEKDLGSKLLTGMGKAISAEFGNLKSYKSDIKNYYKANDLVQSYRFSDNDTETLTFEQRLLNPQYEGTSDDYNKLRKQINQLKFENAPLTKVYQTILQAREEGMDLKTIRSAVRNSSLEYRLSRIEDLEVFYKTLDKKEIDLIEKALMFEDQFFSWLDESDELLSNLINVDGQDRRYYPNIFNRDVYRPFLYQDYRQPRINTYYRKPFIRSPFSAYRSSYFELNPEKKTYQEDN